MKVTKCTGCGAEVTLGPGPCPLCGEAAVEVPARTPRRKAGNPDRYRADMRRLRAELERLRRDDAEVV